MRTLHVVQHTSAEYLGLIEDHLEGRGIRFRYHRPFTAGGGLPKVDTVADGLVILGGGPWGSAGERDLPTLAAEVALVRECLARGVPLVGIGLGAQIVALAAGGAAEPTPLSFRVGAATRLSADALAGYLPARYPLAVYMRDWPAPPPGAAVLARDEEGRACLWQLGARTLGFAGHPGLKVAMVEDLVMEFEDGPAGVADELARLRDVQRKLEDALVPIMTGLIRIAGWMDGSAL
ncbi:MAG: gamma-glutamyl-gamma-aminobutyrate hydrolase family protein [Burkholderiales bacterium]|nr:gamma-glutamyl-gamma-aminobutyrate hydrolase family protein [Burkholderiales bacterium]